ncbi:MAG: ferredoxin family protein [Actinobacteria bacterium]|nr:ferredoxin family protein [Actinomycetota bacterium]
MAKREAWALPNLVTPNRPVMFDPAVCNGCNRCVEMCQSDVFIPNSTKGAPPVVLYPDECWYCGCCVKECRLREEGAIASNWPLMQRVRWKRKDDGGHYRVGMRNPPPPNTKPPV